MENEILPDRAFTIKVFDHLFKMWLNRKGIKQPYLEGGGAAPVFIKIAFGDRRSKKEMWFDWDDKDGWYGSIHVDDEPIEPDWQVFYTNVRAQSQDPELVAFGIFRVMKNR